MPNINLATLIETHLRHVCNCYKRTIYTERVNTYQLCFFFFIWFVCVCFLDFFFRNFFPLNNFEDLNYYISPERHFKRSSKKSDLHKFDDAIKQKSKVGLVFGGGVNTFPSGGMHLFRTPYLFDLYIVFVFSYIPYTYRNTAWNTLTCLSDSDYCTHLEPGS